MTNSEIELAQTRLSYHHAAYCTDITVSVRNRIEGVELTYSSVARRSNLGRPSPMSGNCGAFECPSSDTIH